MNFYLQSLSQEALGASIDFLPRFVSGIFVLILFYFLYKLSNAIFNRIIRSKDISVKQLLTAFKDATGKGLIILGFITILGTWGVNIQAIVAGLLIVGFVLGIACRDCLANVFAGIFILTRKPFILGDKISICDTEGKVASIDIRYTVLESKNAKHLIPNAKLLSEKLTILK
jgi:small-conductance mechanosensitive channel